MKTRNILWGLLSLLFISCSEQKPTSGNPLFPGWYADPEVAVLEGEYWIFPTYSDIWSEDGSKPVYPDMQTAAYRQQYEV